MMIGPGIPILSKQTVLLQNRPLNLKTIRHTLPFDQTLPSYFGPVCNCKWPPRQLFNDRQGDSHWVLRDSCTSKCSKKITDGCPTKNYIIMLNSRLAV